MNFTHSNKGAIGNNKQNMPDQSLTNKPFQQFKINL